MSTLPLFLLPTHLIHIFHGIQRFLFRGDIFTQGDLPDAIINLANLIFHRLPSEPLLEHYILRPKGILQTVY
jgi:hypothetical protein